MQPPTIPARNRRKRRRHYSDHDRRKTRNNESAHTFFRSLYRHASRLEREGRGFDINENAEDLEPELEDLTVGWTPGPQMQRLEHGQPRCQADGCYSACKCDPL
jgi:hypothetical protein